jgi:hypothetical protein
MAFPAKRPDQHIVEKASRFVQFMAARSIHRPQRRPPPRRSIPAGHAIGQLFSYIHFTAGRNVAGDAPPE